MTKHDGDIRAALLGDHEAAKRLTEQGVLLGCPWCGRVPAECDLTEFWGKMVIFHDCKRAGAMRVNGKTRFDVCLAWNTRAAVEMEGME